MNINWREFATQGRKQAMVDREMWDENIEEPRPIVPNRRMLRDRLRGSDELTRYIRRRVFGQWRHR